MKKFIKLTLITLILSSLMLTNFSLGSVSAQRSNFILSPTITDLSLSSYGINWVPDSHTSYITFPNGQRRFFVSGNQRTYYIDSTSSLTLEETIKNNPQIRESFGPDKNVLYRNGYSTIGEVLQTDSNNPYHVIGITQNEQQKINEDQTLDYSNFTTTVGLLESFDGGQTWNDKGPIIRGDDYLDPGTKITGAGQPCAVIKDGFVYIYFIDWASQTKVFHADQIYLARAKILSGGSLGSVEFYTNSGFSLKEENLKPTIPASAVKNGSYSGLPSISYNKFLKKYMAVYETNLGFVMAFSQDAINWSEYKTIFNFPKPQSEKKLGDLWYSYPSILSEQNQSSDQITHKAGNLYFSKGIWPNSAHQIAKTSFKFL